LLVNPEDFFRVVGVLLYELHLSTHNEME